MHTVTLVPVRPNCDGCDKPFASDDGRYRGDGGTGVFEICEKCGERIAALTAIDPQLPELVALRSRILLAAAAPQGHA